MRDRPILFSGPMVRAILDGSKTQTRRVVTPPLEETKPGVWYWKSRRYDNGDGVNYFHTSEGAAKRLMPKACPYGRPGDRLWVRETFYCDHFEYPNAPVEQMRPMLEYRADHDCAAWEAGCPCSDDEGRSSWRPSIHMPRWASRITLELTESRAERLWDITEEDARAEGCECRSDLAWDGGDGASDPYAQAVARGYRADFERLWDSINDARGHGWKRNPWVWVVVFRRVDA